MANNIRKARTGESYYDVKYRDITVADLLLVLEDENFHTEESILEALVTLNYYLIVEACKLEVEQDESEYLTDELSERRRMLDKKIRNYKGE